MQLLRTHDCIKIESAICPSPEHHKNQFGFISLKYTMQFAVSKLLFHILKIGKKSLIFETKMAQIVIFIKKGYSEQEIRVKMYCSKTPKHTAFKSF